MRRPPREVSGILVLDKPARMSSNAALQQVRRIYRAGKGGHTGSLDPLATGLLPICLGQATKLSGLLLDSDKRYAVRAALGACTTTGDAEGEVTRRSDASALTRDALESALPRFTGEILQRPPMYSALKHQGRPLYELARRGEQVEREARPVRILALRLTAFGEGSFALDVRCSKGTYIRTLVEDLAAAVGQCAHVAELRRLEAGPFRESQMVTPASLEQAAERGDEALDALLLPPIAGLAGWHRMTVDAELARRLGQGQKVRAPAPVPPGPVAVVDASANILGLAEADAGGLIVPRRWMS